MSIINVTNLTFAYDGSYDNIFENVSFQIDTDWKLGFTGRNGRGKTTFLNLLLKKYEYSGTISSSVPFEYFPYEVTDKEQLTTDVISSVCYDFQQWQLMRELNLLQVSEDVLYRPFNTLSNGEQTKVLLAALFLKENNFLLIDEPTNQLDVNARKNVGDYLNSKKGFILRNENEKLKKDIKRLSNAAKRTSDWSDKAESRKIGFDPKKVEKNINRRPMQAAKAKKMMSRSKQIQSRRQNAIEEKSKLLKNTETIDSLKIFPLKFHSDCLISIKNISIKYDDKIICENVNFQINQGDRIVLNGQNGCGKSSILKLLWGDNTEYSGEIIKNNQLKISYIPQDTSFLYGSLTEYAENHQIDESLFKTILRKLDFSRTQLEKNIENLSAGQRKKVLISGSLCQQAHLYIWDEPLNYIDIFSRMQIEQLLLTFKPTLLFVEHDKQFQDNIATKIIQI